MKAQATSKYSKRFFKLKRKKKHNKENRRPQTAKPKTKPLPEWNSNYTKPGFFDAKIEQQEIFKIKGKNQAKRKMKQSNKDKEFKNFK